MSEQTYVAFPLAVGADGHTGTVDLDRHISQLVGELLFTDPGERVNRPTLGCGVLELVFDSLNDELLAATQFVIQGRLQEWLNNLIKVDAVQITSSGSEVTVVVGYQVLATGLQRTEVYRR